MTYPLIRELAAADAPHRVPVAVTCQVLGLARRPCYRWPARPATDAELTEAYRANALFDAHRNDPESGHRFLLDDARAAGEATTEPKAGSRVHDDLVRRNYYVLRLLLVAGRSDRNGKLCRRS
ncbi:hypothetical protein ACYF6T_40010 [Streptomyces sp. 7R007]